MQALALAPDFISTVTDAVLAEITAWQSRPLEAIYPVIFFDALRVKIREDNGALSLQSEMLPDVPGQRFVHLVMARHGLLLPGNRVAIDIVPPAMANQRATLLLELPDKLAALHNAICLVL